MQQGSRCESRPRVFLHGVFMFSPCMRGFSPGTPTSSLQSKNMTVRLSGYSKNCSMIVCVHDCLSCVSLCCPVVNWQPLKGVPRLSPDDCWREAPAHPLPCTDDGV
ncbi:hypothetical protein ATANTOWER_008719 [Ataeniobius toweri]|uniref:Uncharacterized protein n=1 Tax=Ataeniobius toweri TaxID=208326 RepID=A0ABU7C9T2_9TELE|nr:hypothetical protein [Ataeniobius toweri]